MKVRITVLDRKGMVREIMEVDWRYTVDRYLSKNTTWPFEIGIERLMKGGGKIEICLVDATDYELMSVDMNLCDDPTDD